VGVLTLYSSEVGAFDEEEMKLLVTLAGDIGFAIDHIDKQERLDHLAYHDAITGLANRTLFLDRVGQALRDAAGGNRGVALFLLDLERFRNINESLGRPVGDALLTQVAQWLARFAGDANRVARVDADHFAVMLPGVRRGAGLPRLVEKGTEGAPHAPLPPRRRGLPDRRQGGGRAVPRGRGRCRDAVQECRSSPEAGEGRRASATCSIRLS
jgi:GGDEF domain-containing protein